MTSQQNIEVETTQYTVGKEIKRTELDNLYLCS
jgi:hypothetical protein